MEIRVKHLRAYLIHSKTISLNDLESYFEKQDLIRLILSKINEVSNNSPITINISHHQGLQQSMINTNEQVNIIMKLRLRIRFDEMKQNCLITEIIKSFHSFLFCA